MSRLWDRSGRAFLLTLSVGASILITFLVIPIIALFALSDLGVMGKVLITNEEYASLVWSAMATTLLASGTSTVTLLILSIPLAYILARTDFRGKSLIEAFIDLPLMIPHAVAGIMILLAYGGRGLLANLTRSLGIAICNTFWGIVAVMAFVSAPIMIDTIRVGFESVSPTLELIARSLGASPAKAFTTVTLPLSIKAICTAAILSWARALSEVGAILIVAYYPKTINVLIIEWFMTYGLKYAVAISVPLVLISLALFTILKVVLKK